MPRAAGSMQNQHGIGSAPFRVSNWLAERGVMQPQFWQRLTGTELKIVNYKIAFRRCRAGRLLRGGGHGHQKGRRERRAQKETGEVEHVSPLRTENLSQTREGGFLPTRDHSPLVLMLPCE